MKKIGYFKLIELGRNVPKLGHAFKTKNKSLCDDLGDGYKLKKKKNPSMYWHSNKKPVFPSKA